MNRNLIRKLKHNLRRDRLMLTKSEVRNFLGVNVDRLEVALGR